MDRKCTFKGHAISAAERLWLQEAVKPGFAVGTAKVRLHGQLPRGFSPDQIDPRLYAGNDITPVGLWHLDAEHPLLQAMDHTIRFIRRLILAEQDVSVVKAHEVAEATGQPEESVSRAMALLGQQDRFYDVATHSPSSGKTPLLSQVELREHGSFDAYLNYEDMDDLLERFYVRRGQALWGAIEYSDKLLTHPEAFNFGERVEYSHDAACAVYAAIETCFEYEGRAHIGNVPRDAATILHNDSGGRLTQAKASEIVQRAIAGLASDGKIKAWAESYRDWEIVEPLVRMSKPTTQNNKVFIVHGHNGEAKESVARFIERLGMEAVILHERPNKGRTIITKFQEEALGASFAVVLMTPDDEGKAVNSPSAKHRARQNVVFELGFFIGKLGPARVAAMIAGDIERPSDFDGVVYIPLDNADWRVKLASELKAAGLEADWSKVLT